MSNQPDLCLAGQERQDLADHVAERMYGAANDEDKQFYESLLLVRLDNLVLHTTYCPTCQHKEQET